MQEVKSAVQRRGAVAWAIRLTTDTPLKAEDYERQLLEQYAHGTLTLDEMLTQMDSQVGYILYTSTATQPFSNAQLSALHLEAQVTNERHDITGLLCYSQGHFVHLLEGPQPAVQALFANIRRDKRHHRIVCLRDGTGPTRWFPDWSMAFLQPDLLEFHWLSTQLEAQRGTLAEIHPLLDEPHFVLEPHLLTLLHAFSALH